MKNIVSKTEQGLSFHRISNIEIFLDLKLMRRLERFAANIFRGKFWQGVQNGTPPGGCQPGDYVVMAIIKASMRPKFWVSLKEVVQNFLMQYYCRVIRDLIRNHAKSLENRCVRSESFLKREESQDEGLENALDQFESSCQCPDEIAMECEKQDKTRTLIDKIKNSVQEDNFILRIFNCMESGFFKRQEIAGQLNVKVGQITNKKKSLCNLCQKKYGQERQELKDMSIPKKEKILYKLINKKNFTTVRSLVE
jgi:hypothetical protein